MARTAMIPRPVVIQLPRRGRARRAARRVGGYVRKHGRRYAKSAGLSAAKALPLALSGAAVGYALSKGYLDKLPQLGGSKVLTLGIAGWAATKFVRNSYVKTAGLAALTAAAFDWGRVQGGGTSGIEDTSDGF